MEFANFLLKTIGVFIVLIAMLFIFAYIGWIILLIVSICIAWRMTVDEKPTKKDNTTIHL